MGIFRPFLAILALVPLLSGGTEAAAPTRNDAQNCAALAGKTISPNTVVETASWMPEGGSVLGTQVDTAFCRIVGVATPTKDSRIGFEVWLPPASRWNGDF